MKLAQLISVIVLVYCKLKLVSGENVLVLCPMSSKSHKNLFDPIISELAKRGNQVTVVSAWQPPQPQENVTDIVALNGFNWARDFNPFEERRAGFMGVMAQGFQFLLDACHEVYANENVINLLQQRFDLVLIDSLANEKPFTSVLRPYNGSSFHGRDDVLAENY
ncbi:unnamed protein product [Allacma fusca]|uniref:Uncharacterized protein n=1 Tax=Allacma fusca TaxID=39272 RepID=A0A8J2JZA7_9HEXA|nr:unnamed protein product [Allacma fusca]